MRHLGPKKGRPQEENIGLDSSQPNVETEPLPPFAAQSALPESKRDRGSSQVDPVWRLRFISGMPADFVGTGGPNPPSIPEAPAHNFRRRELQAGAFRIIERPVQSQTKGAAADVR